MTGWFPPVFPEKEVSDMSGSTLWRKCVVLLTLGSFTIAVSGCGPQSMTGTKPKTGQPSGQQSNSSTTGPGAETIGPGAEVPEAAAATDNDTPTGDDDNAADDKPASE